MLVKSKVVLDKWGRKLVNFEVLLPGKPSVYMSVNNTPYNNEKRGVVIVDACRSRNKNPRGVAGKIGQIQFVAEGFQ